jgi:hypothetical protein
MEKRVSSLNFFLNYKIGIVIFLLVFDALGLFFLKRFVNLSFFADVMNMIISLAVAGISFACYYHAEKKDKNFLLFLFLAFVIRFFGELFWMIYDLTGIVMPVFSFADLAWFLSNLLIIVAFEYKLNKSKTYKKRMIIFFTAILLTLSIAFLFGVYSKSLHLPSTPLFHYLVNESYVLFDLFILSLILVPLYFSAEKKKKSFLFYFFLALGFVATVIYDYFFAESNLAGTYYSGAKTEILYFFSYALFYFSFYFKYKWMDRKR